MARDQWSLPVLLLLSCALSVEGVADLGKPLPLPPSEIWQGSWSTFRIGIGPVAQQQQISILPTPDQSTIWVFMQESCPNDPDFESCGFFYGGIFYRNESSTWKEYGRYELNTDQESSVEYSEDGIYGSDILSLGRPGDGLRSVGNQSIVGIRSSSSYLALGTLGLNPRPADFNGQRTAMPSLLQSLRNMKDTPIPSLSWSYTAGAYNYGSKIFGSLVLGGYDATQFEANDLTFPLGSDSSMDFKVAIQSITINETAQHLLNAPVVSYISTSNTDLWLPPVACQAFQDTFHLDYIDETGEYFINRTQHAANLVTKPTVSFHVGPETTDAWTTINMPYVNFYIDSADENVITAWGGFRFPIRRAVNDTQYILGRAFLQSAHLSADYERNIFNLSQAVYAPASTKADIVAVYPPGVTPDLGVGADSGTRLSTGMIAGISTGGFVTLAIIGAMVFILFRWRKRKNNIGPTPHELEDTGILCELPEDEKQYEVGLGLEHELVGDSDHSIELSASDEQEKPVEVAETEMKMYELPTYEKKNVSELESEGHTKELG
ncbi:acid protease [Decorospora gaudefroyi]|uniref:Acid protease n=1 Tax=Decorospora gaudefroyi TaxID=184978 RepID=A0A6A5K7L2_9PLEO|nr:acid protease [Decorospora gaudefroyi]